MGGSDVIGYGDLFIRVTTFDLAAQSELSFYIYLLWGKS